MVTEAQERNIIPLADAVSRLGEDRIKDVLAAASLLAAWTSTAILPTLKRHHFDLASMGNSVHFEDAFLKALDIIKSNRVYLVDAMQRIDPERKWNK
ncbi:hypothetical protein KAR91_10450 [Candidatus Pacearchaeota archaeon]|nr:hypothetical protein [Candidatus Pacearchaeota archaeon]